MAPSFHHTMLTSRIPIPIHPTLQTRQNHYSTESSSESIISPQINTRKMGIILTLLVVLTPLIVLTPWARVPFPIPTGLTQERKRAITNKQPYEKEGDGIVLEGHTGECTQMDKLAWSAYLEAARKSELYGTER